MGKSRRDHFFFFFRFQKEGSKKNEAGMRAIENFRRRESLWMRKYKNFALSTILCNNFHIFNSRRINEQNL